VDQAAPIVESGDIAIGRGIQALGKGMGEYLIRAKAERDKDLLDDYTIQAQERARQLKHEYEQVRGKDASQNQEYYMKFVGGYDEMKKEFLSEVKDAGVHKDLEQRLELGRINYMEGFINHLTAQGEVYHAQVVEGKIKNGAADMAASYNDDSRLAQAYNRLIEGINQEAEIYGIPIDKSDPAYQNLLRERLTPAHANVITAWVQADKPEEAKEYFYTVKNEISGEQQTVLRELIEESDTLTAAQDFLAEMRSLGTDPAEWRDIARDRFEGEKETAALAQINAYQLEENKEVSDRESFYSDTVYDAWNERGDMSLESFKAANLVELRGMNPKERAAFEKWAYAEETKTDPGVYFDTLRKIRENPEEWRTKSLAHLQGSISFTDLKTLDAERMKDAKLLGSDDQRISMGLAAIGLEKKDLLGKPTSSDTIKARLFYKYVQDGLPRDYSEEDLEKAVNDATLLIKSDERAGWAKMIDAVLPGDWDFGFDEKYGFELGIMSGSAELASMLEDAGYPVTEENLLDAEAIREQGLPVNARTY
jgi:hypothetical protein